MGLQVTSWVSVCLFPGASGALLRKDGRMYGWGILSKCSPMRSSQQTSCSCTRPTLMACVTWKRPIWMARPIWSRRKWWLVSPDWWGSCSKPKNFKKKLMQGNKHCLCAHKMTSLFKWLYITWNYHAFLMENSHGLRLLAKVDFLSREHLLPLLFSLTPLLKVKLIINLFILKHHTSVITINYLVKTSMHSRECWI